jgi:hypothetical protein
MKQKMLPRHSAKRTILWASLEMLIWHKKEIDLLTRSQIILLKRLIQKYRGYKKTDFLQQQLLKGAACTDHGNVITKLAVCRKVRSIYD